MNRRTRFAALPALVLLGLSACGDGAPYTAEAAPPTDGDPSPFVQALMSDAEDLEMKMLGLAEALSAKQYEYRPMEGVMSPAEVFLHVAAYNYYYPSLAGAAIPADAPVSSDYATVGAFEESTTDRDEIIAALRASFEHLRAAAASASGQDLTAATEVFGQASTAQEAWFGAFTHIHEHLGQSIAYARANGIVPPWSM